MFRIIAAVLMAFITLVAPFFAIISVPVAIIWIDRIAKRHGARKAALDDLARIEAERDRRKALKVFG